ncbi:MAG: transcriptional repressor [Treponema sp.]|nr:transcriptional repressor [Treponema sp.]
MLQKLYHTKTTDLISQFIGLNQEKGFTASDLSEFLKSNGVEVNKTTVYRNLEKMTEKGQLIKHKSMISDGFIYQSVEEEHHCEEHIHFQCCKCGSVIHLDDEKTSEYLKSISSELGVKIDLNLSSLNGICQKCRTQN